MVLVAVVVEKNKELLVDETLVRVYMCEYVMSDGYVRFYTDGSIDTSMQGKGLEEEGGRMGGQIECDNNPSSPYVGVQCFLMVVLYRYFLMRGQPPAYSKTTVFFFF